MDREILFRGKDTSTGEWIEGYFLEYPDDIRGMATIICPPPEKGKYYELKDIYVDPDTVGQFTGLCDKNGKKIFEGDEVETSCGEIGIIEYIEEDGMFIISFPITSGHSSWIATFRDLDGNEMEVIGNIHDTPDLVKEEAE